MNTRPNPYVGPRSLDIGDTLYGRERELRQLESLLVAERTILLHSPSGAGKTSLIRAGLIPRLSEDFYILPVVRVNLDLAHSADMNRYLWSTLYSLEEGLSFHMRRDPETLTSPDLDAYLRTRPRPSDAPDVDLLIFDQFEEILTIAPTDQDSKHAFFAGLGAALKERNRWALFAIREDYLGALAPYLRLLPGRLKTTYRLDLLKTDAAREAIQSPPCEQGVTFSETAAEKLVRDLSRVQTQDTQGATHEEQGEYIEPVQLQVVCFNLWQKLDNDTTEITEADLAEVGSVDESLASYYAGSIANVATATGVSERDLRSWVDTKLLTGPTDQPVRGQVRKGELYTEGLVNTALNALVNAHIIRAEPRAGATWYELAHDRLIEPIRKNNRTWFGENLKLFQQQVLLWEQSGRNEELLLRGKELEKAVREAENISLTPDERAFLESCWRWRKWEQRERNYSVRTILLTVAVIATIFVVIFGIDANLANQDAKKQTYALQTALAQVISAKGTAETAKANAIIGEEETKKQMTVTLASQLVFQAQSITSTIGSKQNIAVLLAIQSMKLFPMADAANFLINNNLSTKSVSRMTHNESVNAVAFSRDGKYVVSGSWDKTARVWDAASGREIARMTHDDSVNAVAFSPNNKYVVSGSGDKTARVWDAVSGREIARMTHDDSVNAVAFSPDSKYVVSGSGDKTARVWDAASGREIARMTHDNTVTAVAFSLDEKYVVSGSSDDTARVWEFASGKEVARMTHDDSVNAVAFSPDGKYVVSGSADGIARVWDAASGREVAHMIHNDSVNVVAFSPDGKYVVSGSLDKTARVWEFASGKEVARMTHDRSVNAVAFSPDGKYVVSGSVDKTARVWDAVSGREIARMTHDDSVNAVAFSPNSKYVVSGSGDKTARVWETTSPRELVHIMHDNTVTAVAFSPDGKYVVSGSADGISRVWEFASGREVASMTYNNPVNAVAFSPDDKYVVSGSSDGIARVWETASGREIARMTHGNTVTAVAFSPDGKYVVSGSSDKTARVWESASGREIARMTHDNTVTAVAFSPDGKYVVSGSADDTARVWEFASGRELVRMTHDNTVTAVAFSSLDGKYVVSGSADDTARIWEICQRQGNSSHDA